MPRLISVQTSFTTGEVSFKIKGRSDIEKYSKGLDLAENFRILSQGPIERRNGTVVVQRAKSDTDTPRLLRFIISVTQSFILEFGDFYVRFFTLNSAVADTENPGQPFELETIYSLEEVRDIQYSQAEFSLILTHRNHIQQELIFNGLNATDWIIQDFITSPPPTFEAGFTQSPRTITFDETTGLDITVTADSDEDAFAFTDIGRSIEVVDPHFGVAVITAIVSGDVATVDIIVDFDQEVYEPGEWLLDLSPLTQIGFSDVIRSGAIITVTEEGGGVGTNTFKALFIGDYILANGGVLQILSVEDDGTECKCEILKSMNSSVSTENWTIEVPTWNDERGFPGTVTQAQQRVLFASSKTQSQTLWASESGILNGFGVGAEDADSIEIDVLSNDISTIQWIATARDIIIGTTSGESTINVSTTTLTPTSIEITNRTSFGSDTQTPASIGSEILYIQKGDRKIISYIFDFGTDTFKGEDLTFISEHITESGIKEIVYGQEPNKQIYAIREDGVLISGTLDRQQGVIGFTRYVTDGKFLSVMTIPKDEKDQVWVVVQRTVQNVDRVFIELFDDSSGKSSTDVFTDSSVIVSLDFEILLATNASNAAFQVSEDHGLQVGDKVKFKKFTQWEGIDNKVFTVDNIISDISFSVGFDATEQPPYEGGSIVFKTFTEVTGLDHLEGETVKVKTDNAAHADRVVDQGMIELDIETAEVVVGLSAPYELVTLSKEFDFGAGPMQGQRKRLVSPILRVEGSSPPNVNGEIKPHIREQFNMNQSIPLVSGDLEYSSGAWDDTAQIKITGDDVFPLRLLAIYGTVEGNVK